jgi:hypothetical protein
VPMMVLLFMESSPLTKVSQQAHWRLIGKNGGEYSLLSFQQTQLVHFD